MAKNDILLELDGIKGESGDDKHKDTIEISSYSFGGMNSAAAASNQGGGTGKVSLHDMKFSAPVSAASPELFLAMASGRPIPTAVLFIRKQGAGEQQEFLTFTMEHVMVSSFYQGSGKDGPQDYFTLNFTTISKEYKGQKDDQTLGSAVKTGWNVKANKKH